MNKYVFTTILSSFLLTGCATNGPFFDSWKNDENTSQSNGIYLVEEPYQIKSVWYFPAEQYDYSEQGLASWYMPAGDSSLTANGEKYDASLLTARHKTLPLPSIVKITNMENNKTIIARINDRGPMANNRLIDVSQAAKEALGMPTSGTVMVKVEVMAEESKQVKEQMMEKTEFQVSSKEEKSDDNLTLITPENSENVLAPLDETQTLYKPEDHYVAPTEKTKTTPFVKGNSNVTLGSFANPENAKKLQAKLSQNYPVYTEQVERSGRILNVVKVGPYSKKEAKTILTKLKTEGFKDAYMVQ